MNCCNRNCDGLHTKALARCPFSGVCRGEHPIIYLNRLVRDLKHKHSNSIRLDYFLTE
jgi:hypothetical protein